MQEIVSRVIENYAPVVITTWLVMIFGIRAQLCSETGKENCKFTIAEGS
jgi:hypothetical protein